MTTAVSPFIADPYPTLARLRESAPVSLLSGGDGVPIWLVPRYRDVRAALNDPRLRQDVRRAQELANGQVEGLELGADMRNMLSSDPPDHTRLRRLMQGAFTARRVAAMRPLVTRITSELSRGLSGPVDLVRDFAFPLPIMVICELLGFPPEDRDAYRSWSTALLTHGKEEAFNAALVEMRAYLDEVLARRRTQPRDDMLTDLVRASDAGLLDDDELAGMIVLLLIGGHETTVNLVGTAALTLLNSPGQAAWLRTHPVALPMAVEEFLRYESPVRMATLRFTTGPVLVDDVCIPENELVLLSLGAANRDPERFRDPDRLILDRNDTGHVAFGHGIHRCLGALLGKLEAEVALSALLPLFPRMTPTGEEPQWHNTMILRGLETLPVLLDA
jgi:cytochrome P450